VRANTGQLERNQRSNYATKVAFTRHRMVALFGRHLIRGIRTIELQHPRNYKRLPNNRWTGAALQGGIRRNLGYPEAKPDYSHLLGKLGSKHRIASE
jgi:hypothetical protein